MRAVIFLGDSSQSPLVVKGTEHAWVGNSWVNRLAGQLEVHSRVELREAGSQGCGGDSVVYVEDWQHWHARHAPRTLNTGRRADETLLRASRLISSSYTR